MKIRFGSIMIGFLSLSVLASAQISSSKPPASSDEPTSAVSGSGTTNYIPVWTNGTTLGNSLLYEASGNVGIGTTHPGSALDVAGHIDTTAGYRIGGSNVLNLGGKVSDGNLAIGYLAFPIGGDKYIATLETAVGNYALNAHATGAFETAIGAYALSSDVGGNSNTATGAYALAANNGSENEGLENTAVGNFALTKNTTGSDNTAVGIYALEGNTTGNDLTCIGASCNAGEDKLTNATAIGAHAIVSSSNAVVLGGTGIFAVKVGIGTEKPSNILTIAQGAGHPVSDGWETFSSRRWKTNIQTLRGALGKVEQLRGVSYDLKANGKHEVGVIAEEVGAVVPEVVSYEENGKDARGLDYSRLTALLIEATKEQQRELRQERAELARALDKIRSLEGQVRETRETLGRVEAQVAAAQPALVAAK